MDLPFVENPAVNFSPEIETEQTVSVKGENVRDC